ncbi:MAG: AAA family ATPase [Actinomycetota bacterium]|nr:AAA family ATPase [Actinomycetota bacterium]
MRIESIKAQAFGPLAGDALELSPGMNVVHGPNESGKSSWHAALYVGLCGMKHTRGRASREDQAFTDRYKPWRGASWKVTERIVLDSGRVIQLEHSLGPGGRSTAVDPESRTSLTAELLRDDGALDGAALLGLTRETAVATLFVRQADVLRVLADAGQLQKFLERAAATSSVDTTAEEALARIAAYRRDRVGLLHANSRGPLATATLRQKKACRSLEVAEERYESYQGQVEQRRLAEAVMAQAEEEFVEVQRHESERELREQWLVIGDAQRRLHQARKLAQEFSEGPQDAGSRELVGAVTRALAMFDDRPPAPGELEGPSAEQLEAELAALPRRPSGDLEPAPEVTDAFDTWRQAVQRLRAHAENEPAVTGADELPGATAADLRRLADDLDAPLPQVDPVPDAPRLVTLAAPTSSGNAILPVVGVVIALAGAVLAALLQPIVGAAVLIAGIVLCAVGMMSRNRVQRGPAIGVANRAATTDASQIARIEARRVLQEEARSLGQRRRDAARARAVELGLPVDPDLLRQTAAAGETKASARGQIAGWARRKSELEQGLSTHAEQLRAALASRGVRVDLNGRLDQAFRRYTEACRERRQAAQEAGRAADLTARITMRREAEAAREQDQAARTRAVRQLRAVGLKAGCDARGPAEMAEALRAWLDAETEVDEHRQVTRQTRARLEQLLDGRSMEDLEMEIENLITKAEESPQPTGTTPLEDRSAEFDTLGLRVGALREQVAQLSGQLESAEDHLLDVSEAIEEDAWAEAEVRSLTSLGEDLDLAASILGAAKEKVHGDIAPVLNETIRPWVPRITQGHYDDVRVNPATLELEVHEMGGQFRTASLLSQGTAEQLFLLLRMALAKHLATTGESAPLILDDVTVQSDAGRTTAVLDLLLELSRDRQVVLFTQEDAVRQWATEHLAAPSGRLVELQTR